MKYIKSILFMIISLFITNLIITIFSYFDLLNNNIIYIIRIILSIIIFISTGFYMGYNTKKKAYIEGIKLSLLIILIFTILNLIIPNIDINIKTIIYYLLLSIFIIIGTMIGINKKKED